MNARKLFTFGALALFIWALIQKSLFASPIDLYFHGTYFVVAHFHLAVYFALWFAGAAAVYTLCPKLLHRKTSEALAQIHFWMSAVGTVAVLITIFRVSRVTADEWQNLHHRYMPGVFAALLLFLAAQIIFFVNLLWSTVRGQKVTRD